MSSSTTRVGRYLLAAVLALVPAGGARAACDAPRLFGSTLGPGYSYVYTPGYGGSGEPTTSPDLAGDFWILGAGNPLVGPGIDNGDFPTSSWTGSYALDGFTYPTYIGQPNADSWDADPRIDGCPDDAPPVRCMAVALSDRDGLNRSFYTIVTAPESDGRYSLGRFPNLPIVLAPIPGPRVVNGHPVDATTYTMRVFRPNLQGGHYLTHPCEAVGTGYRVYRQDRPPGGPPPTDLAVDAGWQPLGPALVGNGAVTITCDGAADVYLALTVAFDGGFESRHVSNALVRVCTADCRGVDTDGDGFCIEDCNDSNETVYPGAPQVCDGLNNDCDDPNWPEPDPNDNPADADGDGFVDCLDCDDTDGTLYPDAPQLCDGKNNDCGDPQWPLPPPDEADADGDGHYVCSGDCDLANGAVYPGAPEVCDGVTNDCLRPGWPALVPAERDDDGDGFTECDGDCDDVRDEVFPGAPQPCDGGNHDCDDPQWPNPPKQPDADLDGRLDHCEAYPDLDLHVRLEHAFAQVEGLPLRVTARLFDATDTPVDVPGVRFRLTVNGAATFGTTGDAGLLIEGGGTNTVLVEFVDGVVALDVTSPTYDDVELVGHDVAGNGLTIAGVYESFEVDGGGFTGTGWSWGAPADPPGSPPSGERLYGTFVPTMAALTLQTPTYRVPAVYGARLEFKSWLHANVFDLRVLRAGLPDFHLALPGNHAPFERFVFDLADFRGQEVRFQFRIASSSGFLGWYVDDVALIDWTHSLRFVRASGDEDADGLSNRVEVDRGTDPFDPDTDDDGVLDGADNCPLVPNADQMDVVHPGGPGDACADPDADGLVDHDDRCPDAADATNADGDGDGSGDVCDNCADLANADQADAVHPGGAGDACADPDADGVVDLTDNCPDDANPEQSSRDGDRFGDPCDAYPDTNFHVRVQHAGFAFLGEPLTLTLRLEDDHGQRLDALEGVRFGLRLTGPTASFANATDMGTLVSGGGTDQVVVEFVDGGVELDVLGMAAGDATLLGVDVDGLDADLREQFFDFEEDDGGFVASGAWEWGAPSGRPDGAASGMRVWGTDLDDVAGSGGILTGPWFAVHPGTAARLELRFWADHAASVYIDRETGTTTSQPLGLSIGGYRLRSVDLTPWAGQTIRLQVAVGQSDYLRGVYVDDVTVAGSESVVAFVDPGADSDGDGVSDGDELTQGSDRFDTDSDDDGDLDGVDNCPTLANADQRDFVHPGGAGDACADPDGDGVPDISDACPDLADPAQSDSDADGVGDACDPMPETSLYVTATIGTLLMTSAPQPLELTLIDRRGLPQTARAGMRFTVVLGGSAVFGTTAAEGVLLAGGGTNRALIEFGAGRAVLEVTNHTQEFLRLTGEDSEGLGLTLSSLVENFEADDGDFTRNTSGGWEHGVPTSGPVSATSGTQVWATNLDGDYYRPPQAQSYTLITPPFALAAGSRPRLNFESWIEIVSPDAASLRIRRSGSGNWTTLRTFADAGSGYRREVADLAAWAGDEVELQWSLATQGSGTSAPGWYIDDVAVTDGAILLRFTDPAADPDGDGLSTSVEIAEGSDPFDSDTDNDGDPDGADNCPLTGNPAQEDDVRPGGRGDRCSDPDEDGIPDQWDNCIDAPNPDQVDVDHDLAGDGCDPYPDAIVAVDGEVSDLAAIGQPVTATFRLYDQHDTFRPDLVGARATFRVDGAATFAAAASAGVLLSGGGTQEVALEFVDGLAAIDVQSPVAETVHLDGAPADGTPLTVRLSLRYDFEDHAGGFVAPGDDNVWRYGEPTFGPPESHAGRRTWGTLLDGPVAGPPSSELRSPVLRLGTSAIPRIEYASGYLAPSGSRARMQVSTNGGASWSTPTSSPTGQGGLFYQVVQSVLSSGYQGLDVELRFLFELPAEPFGEEYHGWRVDDVTIAGAALPIRFVDPALDDDGDGLANGDELADGLRPDQVDGDADGVPDGTDNCPGIPNPEQSATCADTDGDGSLDRYDNCPADGNPDQSDVDGDGVGDACDPWPEAALAVQPHVVRAAATGVPVALRLELVDDTGARREDVDGARFQLDVTGSATFAPGARGIVHSGAGTGRVEIGFVDGWVDLTLHDDVLEDVVLSGTAPARNGIAWRDGIFENFEETDGHFTPQYLWTWGPPRAGPGAASSGARAWGADATRTSSRGDSLCLRAPPYALPADSPYAILEFRSWFDSPTGLRSSVRAQDYYPLLTFEGSLGGYHTYRTPLIAFRDEELHLSFCFERDGNDSGNWYVDDFAIRGLPVTIAFGPAADDLDGDGLTLADETARGTDPDLADTDGDGVADGADNCPLIDNPAQRDDAHADGIGDACQDPDGDLLFDAADNCPDVPNFDQADADGDRRGDACDPWPGQYLRVRPTGPDRASTATPVEIVWRLEDSDGALRSDLTGVRVTLSLSGQATFGTGAAAGWLLGGGGTNRAQVEFAAGLVALPVIGAVTENVRLGVLDTEGFGLEGLTDVFEDFERGDGGFTTAVAFDNATSWAYGTASHFEAPSGRSSWFTGLDGPRPDTWEYLYTPVLRLPTATPSTLEVTSLCTDGNAEIEISADGGLNWTCLDCNLPESPVTVRRTFWLGNWAGKDVRARFEYRTGSSGATVPGWVIDDVVLRTGGLTLQFFDAAADFDGDGIDDAAESTAGTDPLKADPDDDGITDGEDNCPWESNPTQVDDVHPGGAGDHCEDADVDFEPDRTDNCPDVPNFRQENAIHPGGPGDACDDPDADAVADALDNCPDASNPRQLDSDGDGIGNACDPCPAVDHGDRQPVAGCATTTDGGGECLDVTFDLLPTSGAGRLEFYERLTPPLERLTLTLLYVTFPGVSDPVEIRLNDVLLARQDLPEGPTSCDEGLYTSFELTDPALLAQVWDPTDRTNLRVIHLGPMTQYTNVFWGRLDLEADGRVESVCAFGRCTEHRPCYQNAWRGADAFVRNPFADVRLVTTLELADGAPPRLNGAILPDGASRACVATEPRSLLHVAGNRILNVVDPATVQVVFAGDVPPAIDLIHDDVGGKTYASHSYVVWELDPRTGDALSDPIVLDDFYSAFGFADGVLFGLTSYPHELREIDLATGTTTPSFAFPPLQFYRDLAWSGVHRRWYTIGDGNRLIAFDPATGALEDVGTTALNGLAVDPAGAVWTSASNNTFRRIDPLTGEWTYVSFRTYLPVESLAFVPGTRLRDCVDFVNPGASILTFNGASCEAVPTADAGADVAGECTSPAGAAVLLDGSRSSSPDSTPGTDDGITLYEWYEDFGLPGERLLATGRSASLTLALGDHAVTLRVTDVHGNTDTDGQLVAVQDTTPPALSVAVEPATLWPPTQDYVAVTLAPAAADVCTGVAGLMLDAVASDEPDDAPGDADGATVDDVSGADVGTADTTVELRAERSIDGAGRRYSVTWVAADGAANAAIASAVVDVPLHRPDPVSAPDVRLDETAAGTTIAWTGPAAHTTIHVVRGTLAALEATGARVDLGPVTCLAVGPLDGATPVADAALPEPGTVFVYLVGDDRGQGPDFGGASSGRWRTPGSGGCQVP